MKEVISIKVDAELKEWLTEHANQIGSSKSEIAELMLIYYRNKIEGIEQEEIF